MLKCTKIDWTSPLKMFRLGFWIQIFRHMFPKHQELLPSLASGLKVLAILLAQGNKNINTLTILPKKSNLAHHASLKHEDAALWHLDFTAREKCRHLGTILILEYFSSIFQSNMTQTSVSHTWGTPTTISWPEVHWPILPRNVGNYSPAHLENVEVGWSKMTLQLRFCLFSPPLTL